jgi:hypothetical protein
MSPGHTGLTIDDFNSTDLIYNSQKTKLESDGVYYLRNGKDRKTTGSKFFAKNHSDERNDLFSFFDKCDPLNEAEYAHFADDHKRFPIDVSFHLTLGPGPFLVMFLIMHVIVTYQLFSYNHSLSKPHISFSVD